MLINNINFAEDNSSLSSNDIQNRVSVGIIASKNNTVSSLHHQHVYSNKPNLIGKNSSKYFFSNTKSDIYSSESNYHTLEFEKAKIALVKPTFTDAAYHNAFYIFYRMYENVSANTDITNNCKLLTSKLCSNKEGSI
ncbi:MAG: hypothetical protein AB7F53_07070 [Nitrososphaeraceae archaeon]